MFQMTVKMDTCHGIQLLMIQDLDRLKISMFWKK